ncbi:MAG TPA: helix-turn-helix domain-containing protein [Rubrobacter sp.]|nr:helix-turn-helix domain-containing protein [Rubrobacter sp.]
MRRYSGNHETSDLRPFTVGHRKRAVGNRLTLQGRFCHAPSPDHPLASERGERAPRIARSLGCVSQTARDAIHDFNERGLGALAAKSSRPKRTREAFDEEGGGGCLRGGAHPEAGLGGGHPGDSFAGARDTLAAGQEMDHLPRSPLRKKKRLASLATD